MPTGHNSLAHSHRTIRVRFHSPIIRNARMENVGRSQSCMVSEVRILWKHAVQIVRGCGHAHGAMSNTAEDQDVLLHSGDHKIVDHRIVQDRVRHPQRRGGALRRRPQVREAVTLIVHGQPADLLHDFQSRFVIRSSIGLSQSVVWRIV